MTKRATGRNGERETAPSPAPLRPAVGPPTATTPDPDKAGDGEPDLAEVLLQCGTDTLHPLPRSAEAIWMGSNPKCDIRIASACVSAWHCQLFRTRRLLSRKRSEWYVRDKSKNGTFLLGGDGPHEIGERRRKPFALMPGQAFLVGERAHKFLALDRVMRQHYPALMDILGDETEHAGDRGGETLAPADAILIARNNDDVLITGEPDCEQASLARILHEISYLRDRPRIARHRDQLPSDSETRKRLKKELVARSTFVLELGEDDRKLDQAFLSMLFHPRNRIRVIVLARYEGTAYGALTGQHFPGRRIQLRPVADRPGAVLRLLDHDLEEQRSPLRSALLTHDNQLALQTAGWPENFRGIREAAARLTALHRERSLDKAAHALSIAPSTFRRWYQEMGLTEPLAISPRPTHRRS